MFDLIGTLKNFHFIYSSFYSLVMSTFHYGHSKPKLIHSKFSFVLLTINK